MAKLGVNIDHIATLRQARGGVEPDPVTAAAIAELAGADGITIHLREDRRHIQERDLNLLRQTVKTRLNLEMAATEQILGIAAKVKPDMCTIVPEKRKELTTEGGLDVRINGDELKEAVDYLHRAEIPVSFFIDPDPEQIKAADKAGADYVEIHTGHFADAPDWKTQDQELIEIENAVKLARKLGLGVNAGHGLNYSNIKMFAQVRGIEEFNIGHSIIARAVITGLEKAVREMAQLVSFL
ncbi:MAG: pyridoxine 5'-phosphate synthase [Desulfuromonadales bacterium]|nr:pyridoxine 5'-phosphate synthase [Desulfuromonadales bacterium]